MKKNQMIMLTLVGVLVLTGVWWFMLYSPRNKSLSDARAKYEQERQAETTLKGQLARLQEMKKNEQKLDLRQSQLNTWVPDQPNLAQFINDATTIAKESGIDFVSITPATPKAGASNIGEIGMAIQIQGGFFQLLDYLVRMEKLPRTVVVDSLQIAPEATTDGSVSLNVGLQARMFTTGVPAFLSLPPASQPAPAAPGGVTAPTSPQSTTTTQPPPPGAPAAAKP